MKLLNKIKFYFLKSAIKEVGNNKSRKKAMIAAKCKLIKKLRETHRLSFSEIGRLLDSHHSTILYLYYKHRNGYTYKGR